MKELNGPEFVPEGDIEQVVIFLHGLGSNGDDLLGLVPYMADALPKTAFLGPNAPFPVPYTFNGYQWFDLWERTPLQIEHGVRDSAPLIVDFIEATAKRFDIPMTKIALVGFSQGTMMALHVGLRLHDGLGGIVGYAGAMVGMESLATEKLKSLPPVLLVHGAQDPIVPLFMSQQAELAIRAEKGDVRLIQRPFLVHSIDDVGIKEGVAFLQNVFFGRKS